MSDREPSTLVVPLRDYLEEKIAHSHKELKTELGHLRDEMTAGQEQSSREHTEVRADISSLTEAVGKLVAAGNREQGASATKGTIWRAALAIVAAIAAMAGTVGAIAGLWPTT